MEWLGRPALSNSNHGPNLSKCRRSCTYLMLNPKSCVPPNHSNRLPSCDENVITGKSTWDETYSDPIIVPIGPVTRARVKKFKDALTGLI
ncbi:hypothetical protein TIFTF001_041997 [Ficus carica]|uniref:Uncharacterized protein n=1 Tax=Ficus carica TaxID=3494 RepID=A0AA88CX98_FICCA|nr:hypothetical protein TIFTF001_041997 [Ficus carica]